MNTIEWKIENPGKIRMELILVYIDIDSFSLIKSFYMIKKLRFFNKFLLTEILSLMNKINVCLLLKQISFLKVGGQCICYPYHHTKLLLFLVDLCINGCQYWRIFYGELFGIVELHVSTIRN